MFEPLTLSLAELAARWNLTPRQVLQHAQQPGVALYFAYEGLAFDVGDHWHRFGGDWDEARARDHLMECVKRGEALIQRAALGQLSEWEQLDDDEAVTLRAQLAAHRLEIRRLKELLEKREDERNRFDFRGYMRAAPSTLWDIESLGSAPFPHKAFHPASPIRVEKISDGPNGEAKLVWDGRLMSLEPMTGYDRHQKSKLTADDLMAMTAEVKVIEALMKAKGGPAPSTGGVAGVKRSWQDEARSDADAVHLKSSGLGYELTNKQLAEKVEAILTQRGVKGPRGRLTAANILRECLQGGKWKRPQLIAGEAGNSGETGETGEAEK